MDSRPNAFSRPKTELGLLLLIVAVLTCSSAASAQYAPGQIEDRSGQFRAQTLAANRAIATQALQDWINVAESGDMDALAKFSTEHALFVTPGGSAQGREQVRMLLARDSTQAGIWMAIGDITAASRLMHVTGRMGRAGDSGAETVSQFSALLELQRDRWLVRMFASAPGRDAMTFAPRDAIRTNGQGVVVPQRSMIRLVVEPHAIRENVSSGSDGLAFPGTLVGGGAGLELDGMLEVRGLYARSSAGTDRLRSFGGELRVHLFELWRVRPHLVAGAMKFSGSFSPDSAWVPHVGGGLSIRVSPALDIRLSARNLAPAASRGSPPGSWLNVKRTHRLLMGAGVGLSLGRRPGWGDPGPSSLLPESFAAGRSLVQLLVQGWMDRLNGGDERFFMSTYGELPVVFDAAGGFHRGPEAVFGFWNSRANAPWTASIRQANVSDDVGYAEAILQPRDGGEPMTVFFVMERNGMAWSISSQAVAVGSDRAGQIVGADTE